MTYVKLNARQKLLLRLFRLFRLVQQQNRFIEKDQGGPLSPMESFLLLHIDSFPLLRMQELAELFQVNQSTISRGIKDLLSWGYVQKKSCPTDKRALALECTPTGRAFLKKYDTASNATLKGFFAKLNESERQEITKFSHRLADGYGTPDLPLRKNDHALRSAMRRLTFSLGMLRTNFMDSVLSTMQWQVLSEVYFSRFTTTPKDLAKQLSMQINSVNSTLRVLRRKRFLEHCTNSKDQRRILLRCTSEGKALVDTIELAALHELSTASRAFSHKDLASFVNLCEKIVGPLPGDTHCIDKYFSWHRLGSKKELQAARAFLVSRIVKEKRQLYLHSPLLASDSYSFSLYRNKSIAAVLDIHVCANSYFLAHSAIVQKALPHNVLETFLERILHALQIEQGGKNPQIINITLHPIEHSKAIIAAARKIRGFSFLTSDSSDEIFIS